MMYRTLDGEIIDLALLSDSHRKVYEEAKRFVEQEPEWTNFTNFWIQKARGVGISVESALFKILQDIDSRLGIRQGLTRLPNWREELELLITRHFKSRYAFCKAAKVDQGHLSAVLGGRKSFSASNLVRILNRIGFRMDLVRADVSLVGEE